MLSSDPAGRADPGRWRSISLGGVLVGVTGAVLVSVLKPASAETADASTGGLGAAAYMGCPKSSVLIKGTHYAGGAWTTDWESIGRYRGRAVPEASSMI
jgi:hypothetical protein